MYNGLSLEVSTSRPPWCRDNVDIATQEQAQKDEAWSSIEFSARPTTWNDGAGLQLFWFPVPAAGTFSSASVEGSITQMVSSAPHAQMNRA
jgi:hypothetical protein